MKERIREQKRMVERSVRGLERDRANLERDEKKLILEIKVRWERGEQREGREVEPAAELLRRAHLCSCARAVRV